MKTLKQILSKNSNFHSLNDILQENYKFKINRDNAVYAYHPNTWSELRQLIDERFEELGPGTAQEPINFNDIDVSGITTFYDKHIGTGIFEDTTFEYIDISDWDVSNIKDMEWSFFGCEKLQSIGDISKWDTSNVQNMRVMFKGCINLKELNLSNWDVSNVTDLYAMFHMCESLESVGDLSNWDVSNVKDMACMFDSCENLTFAGDLSKWDISNIKNTALMFKKSRITNIPDWYKE